MRIPLIAACWVLTGLAGGPMHGEALSDGAAPIHLEPGARGTLLTTVEGDEPEEIPVRFLGTYRDFAGPGHDVHLVELEGPRAEQVGAASGMSGSPVYFDDRLLGALAYRLGQFPKKPIAGITPIEQMLDASRTAGAPSAGSETGLRPIAAPVFLGGLAPLARDWVAPRLEALGFVAVAGGSDAEEGLAGRGLAPGRPVAVELVRGDMRIAASGTVTMVDGDVVYAFGHPWFGTGRVELPMAPASVIHTLADWSGSFQLVRIGPSVGAILEDRRTAIVGRLGHEARMIPMDVRLRGSDYADETFDLEIVASSELTPLLAGVAAVNSLVLSNGYREKTTMLARGAVRVEDQPVLPIEMAFSSWQGTDPALAVAGTLYSMLDGLWGNPFEPVRIAGIDLEVEVRPEPIGYRVESVHYDRGSLRPGEALTVRVVLREHRGETVTREIELPLPDRIPPSGTLTLAVGSPAGIDGVLGDRVTRRLRSATDLRGIIEALREQRSAHRLTAVIYERGGTVVSRGVAYAELPPTAEKLLSLEVPAADRRRTPLVSALARAEVELDGPVAGGRQVRLNVSRGFGSTEEH